MNKIPLHYTDLELYALRQLAKARNRNKEEHGVETKRVLNTLTDEDVHYLGMKAEYGVSRYLDIPWNKKNMLGGDGGLDMVHGTTTIDVKMSQLDLKVPIDAPSIADILILVSPLKRGEYYYCGKRMIPERDPYINVRKFCFRNFLITGWISREEFEEKKSIRNLGYGSLFFVSCKELNDPGRLMKELERRRG